MALDASRGGFSLPAEIDAPSRAVRDVELDEELAAEKFEAALCYRSQLGQLERYFGDVLTPRALARERFWYRPAR